MADPVSRSIGDIIPFRQATPPFYDGRAPLAARPAVSVVPNISSVRAVDTGNSPLVDIPTDAVLRLSDLPPVFNIEAVSADTSLTGSVNFVLQRDGDATATFDRYENGAPYTMQRESAPVALNAGSYTLTVTPYQLPNLGGEVGNSSVTRFTVIDDTLPTSLRVTLLRNSGVSCAIADGDTVCVATGQYDALVENAGTNVTYAWSVSNPVFVFVGASNAASVSLQTMSDQNQFAVLSLTITSDGETITKTLSISHLHSSVGSGADGFTDNSPVLGAAAVYVSSAGSDSAAGTPSTPFATVEHALTQVQAGRGDRIYLRCGDSFPVERKGLDALPSGKNATDKTMLTYYGDPTLGRPKITGEREVYRYDNSDIAREHIGFLGIEFYSPRKDPASSNFDSGAGVPALRFLSNRDILIEDCKFHFSDMTIQNNGIRPDDFVVRRCVFDTIYSNQSSFSRGGRTTNVFTHNVEGQHWEENVFDYGGWLPDVPGAGANQLSHNIYMQWQSNGNKTIFKNNFCSRGASHGAQFRSGGIVDDCLFARCSIGVLMGYNYGGRTIPAGTSAHVLNCVVSELESMNKGGADTACTGQGTCTRARWGFDVNINSPADYRLMNCIASKVSPNETTDPFYTRFDPRDYVFTEGFGFTRSSPNLTEEGNVSYKFVNQTQGVSEGYPDPERTVGSYYASIGGTDDYDAFLSLIKNRQVGTWDPRWTANAINNYIRAGFGKAPI